ncbi:hypothetical protein FE257_006839 [Aspergillus nanangensis]|uniref:Uncharacterized protein n=1 Tax=Aspergillus nanangensis TaxID=2582783 RepID=A0AAD4CNW5_ASPNN|nr:hypothetical protein FE257_006839 [Aspergillus nanangensis]
MWGKMSLHRSRKPPVGGPTLLDTTLDENQYRSFSPIPGTQDTERPYSAKVSSSPPKLPDQSFSTNPAYRVTSSVYSRDTMVDHLRQRSISSTYPHQQPPYSHSRTESSDTISPPRSPVFVGRDPSNRGSGQVSPIDDEPRQTSSGGQAAHKFTSHLPILRKRAGSEQPSNTPSERRQTRWDDFSGEPTSSQSGRFAQATPGSDSLETHASKPAGSANTNIFDWGKDQLRARRKFSEARATPPKNDHSLPLGIIREPWKGPSGRSPMVNPIQEQPRARSSSRVRLQRSNDRLNEYKIPENEPFSVVSSVVTTITGGDGNHKRPPAASRGVRHIQEVPEPSSTPPPNRAPPRVDLPESDLTTTLADLNLTNAAEPMSRFSATTYDPTEVGSTTTASPRDSLDDASQITESPASIMSRRRPVPSSIVPTKQTARKPTPSQASGDFDKALPQCPPEQHAQNRIEILEARRESLARRKANIDTIIHELTQVIQPSTIAYDMAAREEVKKTVASLNNELAEIKREEHEIGVKLLRLWKKRDEQDIYGANTGLWVKRVTS